MYPFVISAPQSASSPWRTKWTVLVKSHFTQAKGAPREVAVSRADGMKWSQVSRAGRTQAPSAHGGRAARSTVKEVASERSSCSARTLACLWLLLSCKGGHAEQQFN